MTTLDPAGVMWFTGGLVVFLLTFGVVVLAARSAWWIVKRLIHWNDENREDR